MRRLGGEENETVPSLEPVLGGSGERRNDSSVNISGGPEQRRGRERNSSHASKPLEEDFVAQLQRSVHGFKGRKDEWANVEHYVQEGDHLAFASGEPRAQVHARRHDGW
eukprot:CAMPEP_0175863782 /NCGR_PEP_ID=MMETSP0107_2-20121207/32673_1 /TAXON_ID=195067 ORGANISM="Goniomonas pacifica, Strain CCMP1869" /NCGR_SAMPLE_ID=MMETSP0107_2 /ASSEMBLY_ACC=CAM_ASM_000203 /LENGTH=108 /DNA_ID=CAMNT_0017180893 /DNA_START=292 /DNA_END=617 /DNA_ORIENTATION=+